MSKDLLILFGTIPWLFFLLVVLAQNAGHGGNMSRRLKSLFLFALVFALIRYGIGYDYFSYKYIIDGNGQDYDLNRLELLPRLLIIISSKTHYQVFFAVCSFLTIWPIYYVSKKLSIHPLYSFTVYLLFPMCYLDGLGVVRNAVAFSMVFLMFYYIHSKKIGMSVICLAVAIGFHVSAVAALVIYPLYYAFHKKSLHLILYLTSFLLPLVIAPILDNYFSQYSLLMKITNNIDKGITKTGGTFYYIMNAMAILNLFYWDKLVRYKDDNKRYLALINIGVVIWNAFLSIDPTTAQRLSMFFILFQVLLVPSYFYIKGRSSLRVIIRSFYVLLFISSLALDLYGYYGKERNMSNIPYQVFFLAPSDVLQHVD